MSLMNLLVERNRMDYNTFVRKVQEYMRRKGINLNGSIPTKDLRQGYDKGLYPSKFVKSYVKQLNSAQKKGGYGHVTNESDDEKE